MYKPLFDEFLTSNNTLRVYEDGKLIFASDKDRLLPLMEYIGKFASNHRDVVIFDKIMGRAAALLCIKANCREVYSPLGSKLAQKVLEGKDIKYHLSQIVPYIQKPNQKDMCPMETLSLDKDPEEFYQLIRNLLAENHRQG
ncbi:DUF1893 domain-containing protein [Chloroflexota bacterium]